MLKIHHEQRLFVVALSGELLMDKVCRLLSGMGLGHVSPFHVWFTAFKCSALSLSFQHSQRALLENMRFSAFVIASVFVSYVGYGMRHGMDDDKEAAELAAEAVDVVESGDPLGDAAEAGNLELVKKLLKGRGKLKVHDTNDYGETPLIRATRNNHIEVAKLLISAGADPNQIGGRQSPLMVAAYHGHVELMKLLLGAFAKVDLRVRLGVTALFNALKHPEAVKVLLDAKADVNTVADYDKKTPLHQAARHGFAEAVKLLLAAKAEVNKKNGDGWTPLFSAARYGHADVMKLLLDAGAEVNVVNIHDQTPLHVATWSGKADAVKLLLEHHASVNVVDGSGSTPLITAAQENAEMVKLLLDAKAEVNVKLDKYLTTPLHQAAKNNLLEVAKMLLDAGADVNPKDSDGETPFDLATGDEVKKLLGEHGGVKGKSWAWVGHRVMKKIVG
eukprot:s1264_g20.t1